MQKKIFEEVILQMGTLNSYLICMHVTSYDMVRGFLYAFLCRYYSVSLRLTFPQKTLQENESERKKYGGKHFRMEEEMTETKKSNKKVILGVAALVVVIAALAIVYSVFRAKPVEGSKAITIEVVNQAEESTLYELKTDAEYLRQAMEEAEGLEFSGSESQYGLTIETINGETTDFNNGSYWSFYVNGDYCNYGVDSQPVYDGDAFQIVYTIYVAE